MAKKKPQRKKDPTFKIIAGLLALLGMAVGGLTYYENLPKKGTMSYGLCKTYLEMQLSYPDSMDLIQVFDYQTKVIMDYRYLDVYGQIRTERTYCELERSPVTGFGQLKKVTRKELGRQVFEEPENKLKLFNVSVAGILANQELIDLTIPKPLGSDLKSFKK